MPSIIFFVCLLTFVSHVDAQNSTIILRAPQLEAPNVHHAVEKDAPRKRSNFDGSVTMQYAKPPTCDCVIDTLEAELPDGNFEMWFTTTQHNILVQGDVLNASIPSAVYQNPEQMPKYLNGRNDLIAYIMQKLQAEKRSLSYQGPISVQLLVSQEGKVMQAICEKSIPTLAADVENSIVNILLHMPPWTAGRVNGKAVNAYYDFLLY